ncbi:BACON domain-containing protein [Odoribacter laneus]|uniref:BACON domain-containing protein n=1 Tax=Odoribacter laneus TaxID=626933 RepID=UPI003FF0CAAE
MKKTFSTPTRGLSIFSTLVLILSLSLSGCKDDKDEALPTLEINKHSISLALEGGSEEIILSTNQSWSIHTESSWLTLDPASGKGDAKVKVSANKNTDYQLRETTLTITAGSLIEKVTVSQPGLEPVLSVNPQVMEFEVAGGHQTLAITSNVKWTTSFSEETDWISLQVSADSTSMEITASPNTTTESREVTLTFNGDQHKTAALTITQEEPELATIAELRNLTANTKTDYIWVKGLVTSDKEGKNIDEKNMIIQDASGNAIALQFTTKHDIALGTQVNVLLNGGSKTTVNGLNAIGSLSTALLSPQPTPTITVNPTVKTIANILAGEVADGLLIQLNEVEFKDITKTYGDQPILWNSSEELVLSTLETATFAKEKVSDKNGFVTGHLTQNGGWKLLLRNLDDVKHMTSPRKYDKPQLKLDANAHTFDQQGGEFVVNVTTNSSVRWTVNVSANADWCTVQPSSGTGSASFTVTVAAYAGTGNRTATLTVTADKADPAIVEITQTTIGQREYALSKLAESNLGAKLAATEENILGPNYKETWGLYYQWGRNVGFPHTGATATVPASEEITAEKAQTMTEFITSSNGDWLLNPGSATTWEARAGSSPCPAGYHVPTKDDLIQFFPSNEASGTFATTQSRVIYEKLVDRPGVPDRTLYVGDGTSKIYAIKKFETADAYALRFEMLGQIGKNLYLKITEFLGNEETYFDNATDAEASFNKATATEVRILPLAGMLSFQDGVTLQAPGAASWYWLDARMRCIYMLNTTKIYENGAQCGYAQPIRCVKD